mgnify:CR=1 FL=1
MYSVEIAIALFVDVLSIGQDGAVSRSGWAVSHLSYSDNNSQKLFLPDIQDNISLP